MRLINIIKKGGLGFFVLIFAINSCSGASGNLKNTTMKNFDIHVFPALPYAYDALEPYIDARTMEVHYDRHHRTYFNNFISAIKDTEYDNSTIEQIFSKVSEAGDAIRNNGGGFFNHVFSGITCQQHQAHPQRNCLKQSINHLDHLISLRKLSVIQPKQGLEADGHGSI